MATQRLIVATLAGAAADALFVHFERCRQTPDPGAIDRVCATIREHALSLPIVYFTEWVDHWLMGDEVPGPGAVEGQRFQASCLTPDQTRAWVERCGNQFAEQEWLTVRFREAANGWGPVADRYAVVVIREVTGPSVGDDEVRATLGHTPAWLLPTA